MKTPEDEAFDEIAKRQGGFQAKRAMAAAKLQEPAQLTEKEKISREMTAEIAAARALAQPAQKPVAHIRAHDLEVLQSYSEQCHSVLYRKPAKTRIPLYTAPPQRTWVGLTDEDCKGMSAGDKVVAMWANRILKEKNT